MMQYSGYQPTSLDALSSLVGAGLDTSGLGYGATTSPINDGGFSLSSPRNLGGYYGGGSVGLTPQAAASISINQALGGGDPTASPQIGQSFESLMGFQEGWNTPQQYADFYNKAKNAVVGLLESKALSALLGPYAIGYDLAQKFGVPGLADALPNMQGMEDAAAAIAATGNFGLTQGVGSLQDNLDSLSPGVSLGINSPTLGYSSPQTSLAKELEEYGKMMGYKSDFADRLSSYGEFGSMGGVAGAAAEAAAQDISAALDSIASGGGGGIGPGGSHGSVGDGPGMGESSVGNIA